MDLIDRSKIDFYKLTGPELRSAIEEAPTVPAVPLDKLCALLGKNADCPPEHDRCKGNCAEYCTECWKSVLKEWMEEQDEAD